ncbi:hypothetical protein HOB87_08000 [Candidatus Woesearchaeota archaeon]|jgi:oligoendopeptidase F|nr:hypothetical protein [Candidatus Woesearchaeota archaeon]
MSDEIAKLIPQENELTLSNGEKITIKTLSWGKEIKVLQIVSKFFDENKLLEVFNSLSSDDDTSNFEAISKLFLPLIGDAPQSITKIVSIIINKDEKFVEESLTSEDVMQVFTPFLKLLFNKYKKMFQKINLV